MATTTQRPVRYYSGKLLHIGCGPQNKASLPREFHNCSETRLDIDENVKPDVVADMRDLSMFDEGSFDVVYSSHNIEHLFLHEVLPTLKEWRRVLKPDGLVSICCPDLQSVCEAVVNKGLTEPLFQSRMGPIAPIDILYGHTAAIGRGSHYMAHKTGFTADSLSKLLKDAGFSSGRVHRNSSHYELLAVAHR